MPKSWDDFEVAIERGLQNNGFAEEFLFTPRIARNNKPTINDPDRPQQTVCGIFTRHYRSDDFNPSALSTRGLKFSELAQRDPILEIVAADLPYAVKQGDYLTRCKDGREYEVTNPEANGHGILFIKLIERGISSNAP